MILAESPVRLRCSKIMMSVAQLRLQIPASIYIFICNETWVYGSPTVLLLASVVWVNRIPRKKSSCGLVVIARRVMRAEGLG